MEYVLTLHVSSLKYSYKDIIYIEYLNIVIFQVDFFRFSLSWSRILPTGYPDEINHAGLKFYKDLIDKLIENDIVPLVTLYHWDHPEVFESMGGWTNELMIDWISDYARIVFRELGSKAKYFIPINEPVVFCEEGYMTGQMAPGI